MTTEQRLSDIEAAESKGDRHWLDRKRDIEWLLTTLRATEARAEESEKAHEADTVAAAELIDLLHTRVATAEADAKALRETLGEIAELVSKESVAKYTLNGIIRSTRERIAALAAIQDEEKKL